MFHPHPSLGAFSLSFTWMLWKADFSALCVIVLLSPLFSFFLNRCSTCTLYFTWKKIGIIHLKSLLSWILFYVCCFVPPFSLNLSWKPPLHIYSNNDNIISTTGCWFMYLLSCSPLRFCCCFWGWLLLSIDPAIRHGCYFFYGVVSRRMFLVFPPDCFYVTLRLPFHAYFQLPCLFWFHWFLAAF